MSNPDDTTPIAVRIAVCQTAIAVLKGCPEDPRQPEALRYYEAQLQHLLERQAAMPAPTTVALKTAVLTGKIPTLGG